VPDGHEQAADREVGACTGRGVDQPEALDLGSAVLPVLARAYWKQGVGAPVVLALLWRLLRR